MAVTEVVEDNRLVVVSEEDVFRNGLEGLMQCAQFDIDRINGYMFIVYYHIEMDRPILECYEEPLNSAENEGAVGSSTYLMIDVEHITIREMLRMFITMLTDGVITDFLRLEMWGDRWKDVSVENYVEREVKESDAAQFKVILA
jgi:hypothetical protein